MCKYGIIYYNHAVTRDHLSCLSPVLCFFSPTAKGWEETTILLHGIHERVRVTDQCNWSWHSFAEKHHPLLSSDNGRYKCEVTIRAQGETSSPAFFIEHMTINAVVCSKPIWLLLQYFSTFSLFFPQTHSYRLWLFLHLLKFNVCPYNQFSLNCTASAHFEEAAMQWVWIGNDIGPGLAQYSIFRCPYVDTGSPEKGYTSNLITNETDSANLIRYRCRALLTVDI